MDLLKHPHRILNTFIPAAVLLASLLALLVHALLVARRQRRSELRVSRLDPAASSIYVPEAEADEHAGADDESGGSSSRNSTAIVDDAPALDANGNGHSANGTDLSNGAAAAQKKKDKQRQEEQRAAREAASLQVFRTENAVILNEVHATPLTPPLTTSEAKRMRRFDLAKRLIEVGASVGLVGAHAAAFALQREWAARHDEGEKKRWHKHEAEGVLPYWELAWCAVWAYFAVLAAYTLTTRRSYYKHKTSIIVVYLLVALLNLRTAVLLRDGSAVVSPRSIFDDITDTGNAERSGTLILRIVQVVLAGIISIPSFFFPLKRKLPQSLRAIHRTMRAEKRHGVPGTVRPTPQRRASGERVANGEANGIDAFFDEEDEEIIPDDTAALLNEGLAQEVLRAEDGSSTAKAGGEKGAAEPVEQPSPELYASLYSRLLFGFITPELFKHYRSQYRPEQVPDLCPDDKSAAVVSDFRAKSGDASLRRAQALAHAQRQTQKQRGKPANDASAWQSVVSLPGKLVRRAKGGKGKGKPKPVRSLTMRLVYFFWPLLLYQASAAFVQAILSLSPPLGLQYILTFIAERGRRQREGHVPDGTEAQPVHMAVLYAVLMLLGQTLYSIAASQSLMTGRKICINVRSILITEIMTKVLRRRDMSGEKEDAKDDDEKEGAGVTPAEAKAKTKAKAKAKAAAAASGEGDSERATDGQVVNLVSVDVFKVAEVSAYLHMAFPLSPVQLILSFYFLWKLLGWSAVAGFVGMLVSMPLQAWVSTLFLNQQKALLEVTDKRLNLCSEVLGCIKTVKFFAWEKAFQDRIEEIRRHELWLLLKRYGAWLISILLFRGMPIGITVLTFTVHTKILNKPLPPEIAFSSLAFFTTLRSALDQLPTMLANILSAVVSVRRIDTFLREDETPKYAQLLRNDEFGASDGPYVGFTGKASFTYSDEDHKVQDGSAFVLRDLDITFPEGQLSIVAGSVGSGKSTLLMSLLGETRQLQGKTFMPCPVARSLVPVEEDGLSDTVAYCSQTPWLLSTSVRENILFGSPYDERRYKLVIKACALDPDLKILEYYDETLVGEKGTALSGGQKARISLARALYSTARVLLIDDALSALDATTSEYIYRNYLKGSLVRGRTVVMVAHAVTLCLPGAGYVVALDDGKVVAQGRPSEVLASGIFADEGPIRLEDPALHEPAAEQTIEALDEGQRKAEAAELKKRLDKKAANADEEAYAEGAVGFKSYLFYFSNFAPNALMLTLLWTSVIALFFAAKGADVTSAAWLRKWASTYDGPAESIPRILTSLFVAPAQHAAAAVAQNATMDFSDFSSVQLLFQAAEQPKKDGLSRDSYLAIYAAIALGTVLLEMIKDGFSLGGSVLASRRIYSKLMTAIFNAKPGFFDKTPVGRIMNRIAKDMETIDQDTAADCVFFIDVLIQSVAILGIVIYAIPIFSVVSILVILGYGTIGALYIVSSRDLKRIESVQRSPIYSLVGEILNGSVAIRAFGDAGRFVRHSLRLIDKTNRPFYMLWMANRWLSLRVDIFAALISFTVAIFLIGTPTIDAGLAGFALSYAIMLVDSVLWVVRVYSMCEINMNSIERVQEYLTDVEPERFAGTEPPAYWPSQTGNIVIDNLSVRYSKEFPRVLHSLSLEIQAGHKVGIVGRTGSGKSSLTLALFRFLEAEEGKVTIDGIDISTVPLKTLRQRLTVIPQQPDLFSGTVRSNLDPFGQREDAELWNALERCKLATPADVLNASRAGSRLPSRPPSVHEDDAEVGRTVVTSLDMPVEQNGRNFSQGQRQLLALARGLLKLQDSRILILDESTASLDAASDAAIQQTIRQEMSSATILTVAHRLRTIADFDRVLVLDRGKIVEYAAPYELLTDEKSSFYELAQKSGEFDHLLGMAKRQHEASGGK